MELLAPAGNIVNFQTALNAGADSVYVGAPGINARNLSRDHTFEEIRGMVEYGHDRGKKIYLAANSLILEADLSHLLETLALFREIGVDALIVQDYALIRIVREYFPELPLHASTLMGAFNSETVEFMAGLGCERVVLARELTLKEIEIIAQRTDIELEVFVHGAMCYSYSGLCLFSSFLGGKSGLRGKCVQPCRRGYSMISKSFKDRRGGTRKTGGNYLFSMNDLVGIDGVKILQDAGVASLKIEGRMRSANYVHKIVEAYRLVLDSSENEFSRNKKKALELVEEALGRKTTPGYFFSPQPQDCIVPYHSGNMGLHLGNFKKIQVSANCNTGKIKVKNKLTVGDRLRLHIGSTGERKGFTLRSILIDGRSVQSCKSDDSIEIELPVKLDNSAHTKVDLYKVDSKDIPLDQEEILDKTKRSKKFIQEARRSIKNELYHFQNFVDRPPEKSGKVHNQGKRWQQKGSRRGGKTNLELWLRTDSPKLALSRLFFQPAGLILNMEKNMVSQSARIKKHFGRNSKNIVWSLPPVLFDKDLGRMKKQVKLLIRSGFRNFQVAHISQIDLFSKEKVHIWGDYSLNITNSYSLHSLELADFSCGQVAIELDNQAISKLISGYKNLQKLYISENRKRLKIGMTIYGIPPLFTSRLACAHFNYNKQYSSPKGELIHIKKKGNSVLTLPEKPFSLFPYINDLKKMGLDYGVIDLTNMRIGEKEQRDLMDRISGKGRAKLPTFNYLGTLE